jgi:hypothetical protein
MAPDPPLPAREVKSNNQLATRASKAGGGWQERVNDHMTTTAGDDKQQEHVCNDEGNNEDGKGSKGNGDNNEGAGHQGGQGWQGPWHWQQGWHATKRAMVTEARAMAMRVVGEQR